MRDAGLKEGVSRRPGETHERRLPLEITGQRIVLWPRYFVCWSSTRCNETTRNVRVRGRERCFCMLLWQKWDSGLFLKKYSSDHLPLFWWLASLEEWFAWTTVSGIVKYITCIVETLRRWTIRYETKQNNMIRINMIRYYAMRYDTFIWCFEDGHSKMLKLYNGAFLSKSLFNRWFIVNCFYVGLQNRERIEIPSISILCMRICIHLHWSRCI